MTQGLREAQPSSHPSAGCSHPSAGCSDPTSPFPIPGTPGAAPSLGGGGGRPWLSPGTRCGRRSRSSYARHAAISPEPAALAGAANSSGEAGAAERRPVLRAGRARGEQGQSRPSPQHPRGTVLCASFISQKQQAGARERRHGQGLARQPHSSAALGPTRLLPAALASEPPLPLQRRLFQEGKEQPELLLPRGPSAAEHRDGPSRPQGPGVCGSGALALTASWGRDTRSPGPGSHPQSSGTSGAGDAAPAITSPALTPISPRPGKLLHGRGCGYRAWSSRRAHSRRDATRWTWHTGTASLQGGNAGPRPALGLLSPTDRPHNPWLNSCPPGANSRVRSQPMWVPGGWQDTANAEEIPGGTASSSPATGSQVGTDRRSRVPYSPTSTRQLLLPWEGGDMALGAARKVLYSSTEGNSCTTSHPSTGPSPGPFQPCTSSLSLPGQHGHISVLPSAPGQRRVVSATR